MIAFPWVWFGVVVNGHGQFDPQPLRPPLPVVFVGGGDFLLGCEDALPDGSTTTAIGEDDMAVVDGDGRDVAHLFLVRGVCCCRILRWW